MSNDQDDGMDMELPESLLPYDEWVEDAYREVMLRAIEHVSTEGLPGDHHFYLTFLTNYPGVDIPSRLRAQYPHDMTIVIQHQFWDLTVDRERGFVSVGLSFGGIGSTLVIPFGAITAFADPYVRMALRFNVEEFEDEDEIVEEPAEEASTPETLKPAPEEGQVVSLDAFRKRPPEGNR
ncbi:SspB family protein [Kozakia baliensis]|uniref:SspB family protein n=1 Tax=Kozakia baliensis TaxID=153496 RepID=UPI0004956E19|nr:ClpXP protease specificity-enhancing factor SspB [Kozakia baliensis]